MRARLLILTTLVVLSAGLMAATGVAIESENLYVDETRLDSGIVTVTASNEEYALRLVMTIDFQAEARYESKDLVADSSWLVTGGGTLQVDSVRLAIGQTIEGRQAVHGMMRTEDGTVYALNLLAPDALAGDTRFEDYEAEFGQHGVRMFVQGQEQHGVVVVYAANTKGQVTSVAFVGKPNTDTLQVIAPGQYEVSEMMTEGTVVASPGKVDGRLYASYAGWMTKEGIVCEPVWFLTEGEAEVTTSDGLIYIRVEARNSYGRSVRLTIEANPKNRLEDVEEVRVKSEEVRKEIREGRVVIVRGERVYDVMGRGWTEM